MNSALSAIAGFGIMLAGSAAESAIRWDRPNHAPYRGSIENAIPSLIAAGAPVVPIASLQDMWNHGLCTQRDVRDGEHFDLMLSAHGVMRDVVAFSALWAPGTDRTLIECRVDIAGMTYLLLYPQVCGNWAFESYRHEQAEVPPVMGWNWGGGGGGSWGSIGEANAASYGWGVGVGGFAVGGGGFAARGRAVQSGNSNEIAQQILEAINSGPSGGGETFVRRISAPVTTEIIERGNERNSEREQHPVPEPATTSLLLTAMGPFIILAGRRWRNERSG